MIHVPICKRLGLSLQCESRAGREFAGLFWKTWLRLPQVMREVLLSAWTDERPGIFLADDWDGRDDWAIGQSSLDSKNLWYSAHAVSKLSRPAVMALVAHELLHAFRYLTGQHSADVAHEEWTVREICCDLGFDGDALDREFDYLICGIGERPTAFRQREKAIRAMREVPA